MRTTESKFITPRLIIVALLGGGMLLQSMAEPPLRERDAWPQAGRSDWLLWCAIILGMGVLVLLWRGLRLRTELSTARAQLASERELRHAAERARQHFQRQICRLRACSRSSE